MVSFLGILGLIFIAWVFSAKRKKIIWKPVIWGVLLQIVFGMIVMSPKSGQFFFNVVDKGVKKLLYFSEEGAAFVFQATQPHTAKSLNFATGKMDDVFVPGGGKEFRNKISPIMKTFAFWVLPTIIFFSALMTVLYHIGIMGCIIKFFAFIMQKTMGTSGAETLSAAANIFVGQTEAPLVIKPFVEKMTKSELHSVMVGGFATVAGGVMAAYVSFLKDYIPGIAGHLVTASIMSAPAALAISKVIYPETEEPQTKGKLKAVIEKPDANVIEAAARGATEGWKLALNVAAMLIAFVGLVSLINYFLGIVGLSLEMILSWVFAPISWMMGVPWNECSIVGTLLGEKLVLTEFLAYIHLGEIMRSGIDAGGGNTVFLSQRSAVIASYALCGFANFASIGIQIGGIGGIAPSRRSDLAKLGLRAMAGGAIAACMTGTIAGIFY
ncbi:NupC/NupG family nucleoside CNT transporter [Elusimicrobiota bacterium]